MKSMVKKIFLIVTVVLCCGAVGIGGGWCATQQDDSLCTIVQVVVKDSLERQFVDVDELTGYLKQHRFYPEGKTMTTIDCHAIEECLQKHDMVREVECYKSPFGCVNIVVEQRVPKLQVVSNDGCYYVDTDRRIMPARQQIEVEVPVFKGNVSERAAREEYFDFVDWLNSNRYWRTRICDVYVANPKHLILAQKGENTKIILGPLDEYSEKLNKLQKLYTKGFSQIGYPDVSEYDLRFTGQVVGRK